MKLYEISTELAAILDQEELTPEDEARLDELGMAFDVKVENVLKVREGLLAEAVAVSEECSRLKERAEAMKRRAEWLRGYVLKEMQRTNVGKVSGPLFTATVAKCPLKVEVEDGAEVPFAFQRTKVSVEVDKAALLEAFKRGDELPPGVTVTQGTTLRIS